MSIAFPSSTDIDTFLQQQDRHSQQVFSYLKTSPEGQRRLAQSFLRLVGGPWKPDEKDSVERCWESFVASHRNEPGVISTSVLRLAEAASEEQVGERLRIFKALSSLSPREEMITEQALRWMAQQPEKAGTAQVLRFLETL